KRRTNVGMPSVPYVVDLTSSGLSPTKPVLANLSPAALVEAAVARGEGQLTDDGALTVSTGKYTGRSPKDRFIVRETETDSEVAWGGFNNPIGMEAFVRIERRIVDHLNRQELFVLDGQVCADPAHRVRVRVVAEKAWQTLFAHCLFQRPTLAELQSYRPDWHVL